MKERIIIYTDGSCDNNGDKVGGIGITMSYKGKEKEIYESYPPPQTNNTMELMAVIRAIENIKTTKIPMSIHSDSAYVLNCFLQNWRSGWEKNGWKNSKKKPVENKELWQRLFKAVDGQTDIEWVKVKGHVGIPLNEKCDQLAKLAVEEYRENHKEDESP